MKRVTKFSIYRLDGGQLVLDCQADLLRDLNTRVVVPLFKQKEAPEPLSRLNPLLDVDGAPYFMMTQFMATATVRELGQSIGSLEGQDSRISNALDMLFIGY